MYFRYEEQYFPNSVLKTLTFFLSSPLQAGLLNSSERLNRAVSVDAVPNRMTVEGGIKLRELLDAAAARRLALAHS